ncbi:MAG: hypothetical protein AABX73_04450 [Nanoarchaeota archaeon]
MWSNIQGFFDVKRSHYDGPIAIRALIPGLGIKTHISQKNLEKESEKYCEEKGCERKDILYSEMAAPSMGIKRILNAELTRNEEGLYMAYSGRNIHMNEAMREAKVATHSTACSLLEFFNDPSDLNDLNELLEEYPNSVIEMSVLDKLAGWARRRMLIWEIRDY